jgi:hypothetical protein
MLVFPSKTVVGRIMPKEAFYKRLTLKSDIREKFVSDIKRIVLEYKLSSDTLNVEKGKETSEILVLSIDLKKQELDYRILENIARQNAHKLLFLLKFEELGQLAVYYNKLHKTKWMSLEEINLVAKGLNLDYIWDKFIEQIALKENVAFNNEDIAVEEKLKKQDYIQKLQREIVKLERKSRKEKQPKKRFEQFTRLQELKKKLANEKGE